MVDTKAQLPWHQTKPMATQFIGRKFMQLVQSSRQGISQLLWAWKILEHNAISKHVGKGKQVETSPSVQEF